MRKPCSFLFCIVLLYATSSFAQEKEIHAGGYTLHVSVVDTTLNEAFCAVGIEPEFPGGIKRMVAFAKRNIRYPKTAVQEEAQGKVLLQFVIDKTGKVTDKEVVQSACYELDSVCLRMLNKMPHWTPGRINGKSVACYLRWPIIFVLKNY